MPRSLALGLVVVTIALGLASRKLPVGVHLWDKSLGDALYTVMIYFFAVLARPVTRPLALGAFAFAVSFAIELFQATGIPARMPRLLQIVLGTAFAWHDVACYAVGAIAVALVHTLALRWRAGASAASPPR